ncbi:MAG: hypothetical protein AB7L90_25920 [Hyphomicrobiaceae bacterium]
MARLYGYIDEVGIDARIRLLALRRIRQFAHERIERALEHVHLLDIELVGLNKLDPHGVAVARDIGLSHLFGTPIKGGNLAKLEAIDRDLGHTLRESVARNGVIGPYRELLPPGRSFLEKPSAPSSHYQRAHARLGHLGGIAGVAVAGLGIVALAQQRAAEQGRLSPTVSDYAHASLDAIPGVAALREGRRAEAGVQVAETFDPTMGLIASGVRGALRDAGADMAPGLLAQARLLQGSDRMKVNVTLDRLGWLAREQHAVLQEAGLTEIRDRTGTRIDVAALLRDPESGRVFVSISSPPQAKGPLAPNGMACNVWSRPSTHLIISRRSATRVWTPCKRSSTRLGPRSRLATASMTVRRARRRRSRIDSAPAWKAVDCTISNIAAKTFHWPGCVIATSAAP